MSEKYILLVDDNPDDVALTERAFKKCGINDKLTVAWNGEEALDFLFGRGSYASRDNYQKPAVILLDLKLPLVSGLEVLRQIRSEKSTQKIPVIVLTSSIEKSDKDESYRLGADDFHSKPVDYNQFLILIQKLSSRWLNLANH